MILFPSIISLSRLTLTPSDSYGLMTRTLYLLVYKQVEYRMYSLVSSSNKLLTSYLLALVGRADIRLLWL